MFQRASTSLAVLLAVAVFGLPVAALAENVLIINGSSATSETGTTADITANLSALETAAGNVPTVMDVPPASLAGFDEVWDIRFANASPLSASDQTLYLAFLQAGKRMFIMGENAGFATRDDSVIAFVTSVGGGNLTFVVPGQTQTVNPPFNLPNAVSSFTYNASGGTTSAGTGAFATNAGTQGSAVFWNPGQLTNATGGRLVVVFDVNFMQAAAGVAQTNFLKNLIGFVTNGGGGGSLEVPTLRVWALVALSLILGLFAVRAGARRRR
jgi:hypothetical protein